MWRPVSWVLWGVDCEERSYEYLRRGREETTVETVVICTMGVLGVETGDAQELHFDWVGELGMYLPGQRTETKA